MTVATRSPNVRGPGKKVAVITGASRGIGAGLVRAFRGIGYSVVATSRSIDPSNDYDQVTVRGDIAEVETAHNLVRQAVEHFGRVDTLVNNAGIYLGKPFTDYTLEDFAAMTAVNLEGFFHVTQRVIGQMLAQGGGGHVVNVTTSLVDHASSTRPAALTSLTKGGLNAVTRALAVEYVSHGIRVNAVALGVIRTQMQDVSSYEGMGELHPIGRVGEIGDVVDGVLYLERASFVTGEILHIDGGQTAGLDWATVPFRRRPGRSPCHRKSLSLPNGLELGTVSSAPYLSSALNAGVTAISSQPAHVQIGSCGGEP